MEGRKRQSNKSEGEIDLFATDKEMYSDRSSLNVVTYLDIIFIYVCHLGFYK